MFPLNAIVDVGVAERAGWTPLDLAAAYLGGGARFLQLRAKTLSGAAFLELSSRVCEIAHAAGAIVIVNDRADVARLSGADGLHVGQEDLPARAVRALLGPGAVVGLSTHTEAQTEAALLEPVTYVAVGPVFGTATKATGYSPVGLERVRGAAAQMAKVRLKPDPTTARLKPDPTYGPDASLGVYVGSGFSRTWSVPNEIVAIGGITLDTATDVLRAGATSVAVITDLLATGDPEARVRAFVARLAESRKV